MNAFYVFKISGFQSDTDIAAGDAAAVAPLMEGGDDVGALLGDDLRHAGQFAGFVCYFDSKLGASAGCHQTAGNDTGQDSHIDVAAGKQADHFFCPPG